MIEHVCARCGDYRILLPTENISSIAPVPGQTRFLPRLRHRYAAGDECLLDLRRLLAIPVPLPAEHGVMLAWRSTDGSRHVTLIVDAVEEIVNCNSGDLIAVPVLPPRLHGLCDSVMRDPRGTLRLRVRADVVLALASLAERRSFAQARLVRMADFETDGAP